MLSYENICLEGGGIKAIAFCGALKVLEEKGIMKNIKRYIGSSGGAIAAAALACGYTADELRQEMLGDDFGMLQDDSWGFIRDIYRIVTKFGLYKGDVFEEWLGGKIAAKTGNADITFKEIYEKYSKILVVTGACLNKRKTYFYHYQSNPDMPIRKAVRISISLPLFMQAVFVDGDVLVDGGLFNNYPISYFDGIDAEGVLPDSKKGIVHLAEELSDKTIGLKLLSPGEQAGGGFVFEGNDHIRSLKDFIVSIVNSYGSHVENLYIKPGYWERTISINTGNIKTTQFELTKEEKEFLIGEGKKGADKFMDQQGKL